MGCPSGSIDPALENVTSSGAGPEDGLQILDAADLADPERARDVGVPEVDVVERPVGSFGQVHDVTGRLGRAPADRLEVVDAGDVSVRIERETLDPVLDVVGKEVVAAHRAR